MPQIERISTGIPGLDPLIEGGFVKGSSNLIAGDAGTGKTIICCQFIWEGLRNGENCMFLTLEESPQDIIDDAALFGWDFATYVSKGQLKMEGPIPVKQGKLIIEYRDPFQTADITTILQEEIIAYKITRVIIDSTSTLGLYFKDPHEIRKQLYKLIKAMKEAGVTSILTAEIPEGKKTTRFGVEEYVTDAAIMLYYTGLTEGAYRQLEIKKMRRTNQKKGVFPYEISSKGIIVKKSEF